MAMHCAYHPDREPVGACVACGKLICADCKATLGGKIYCTPCADKLFVQKEEAAAAATTTAAAATAATVETPTKSAAKATKEKPAETIVKKEEPAAEKHVINNSGRGAESVLPAELKGWNWGAFFLNWIWGIGNSTWIALLCFIPLVNIVMIFILGARGNEWAWRNKTWDSVEHFRKTQRTWKRWGVALFIIGVVIGVIYAIIAAVSLMGMGINVSL
jgi:hypothetical protein